MVEDDEELRKAWEARLEKKRRDSITVINVETGRKMEGAAVPVNEVVEKTVDATRDMGTGAMSGW